MASWDKWQVDIVKIAKTTYDELVKTFPEYKDYIIFNNNNLGNGFSYYSTVLLPEIRNQMNISPENIGDKRIDRHKIITAYINTFLSYPLITIDEKKFEKDKGHTNIPLLMRVSNKYFCYNMMLSILGAQWTKRKHSSEIYTPDNICDDILNLDNDIEKNYSKEYQEHFYQLLFYLEKQKDHFPTFAMSQLIFYIEMASRCIFNSMQRYYFKDIGIRKEKF